MANQVALAGLKSVTGSESDFLVCSFSLNGVWKTGSSVNPTVSYDNVDLGGNITLSVSVPSGYRLQSWYDFNFNSMGNRNPQTIANYASYFFNRYGQSISNYPLIPFYAFFQPSGSSVSFDTSSMFELLIAVMVIGMMMKMMTSMIEMPGSD